MKYKTNKLMDKRLKSKDIYELAKQYPLESKLQEILDLGIYYKNDIYVFKYFTKGEVSDNLIKKNLNDLTGLEMNFNDLHTDFYIPKKKATPEYVLQQGVAIVVKLIDQLNNVKKDSKDKFKIILSTEEGEDAFRETSNISFHKIRENETEWLMDNLESYETNGLLVVEI